MAEQIKSRAKANPPFPFLVISNPSNTAAPDAGVPGILRYVAGISPAKIAVNDAPRTIAKPAKGVM